ncbi:MAG: hypothetical protein ACMXYG_05015 [Candidatus Woesearchaeota archaeon]
MVASLEVIANDSEPVLSISAFQTSNTKNLEVGNDIVLPIERSGRKVSFCLIEIGCKPNGKINQVRKRKQSLLDYFNISLDQVFNIYHGFAYFNGNKNYGMDKFARLSFPEKPDFCIHHHYLDNILFEMDGIYIDQLLSKVPNSSRFYIEEVIKSKDIKELNLMLHSKKYYSLGDFRGYLAELTIWAELMHIKKVSLLQPNNIYSDYYLRFYQQDTNSSEFDIIVAFYDDNVLRKILGRMQHKPNISVTYKHGSAVNMLKSVNS